MRINEKNMALFWKYITERHSIYKKKTVNEKPPWTQDTILQKYKFTNVFRYLDPGTKYVIERILPQCKTAEEVIFNSIVYRIYNRIQTFDAIGIQDPRNFDKNILESKLRSLKQSGENVFTNAFIVSGYASTPGSDKIERTVNIIDSIAKKIPELTRDIETKKSSEYTFTRLVDLDGIGKFLGYQIAVDIGYWSREIFNEDEFVVAGPGCINGLNRIFIEKAGLSYEDLIAHVVKIQDVEFEKLGVEWNEPRLNLMAIENCLCEFSKYCKVYYNEGRPRNHYTSNMFV